MADRVRPLITAIFGLLLLSAAFVGVRQGIPVVGTAFLVIIGGAMAIAGFGSLRRTRRRESVRTNSPDFHNWLVRQLRILRPMGFFEDRGGLSDEALARELAAQIDEEDDEFAGDWVHEPCRLAMLDTVRTVHFDTEMDPLPGDGGYTELLTDLARISRGVFKPSAISETLSSDGKHVDVSFELDGTPHALRCRYDGDWVDPSFLVSVDKLIASSGRSFTTPQWGGQDCLIVCLSEPERLQLRKELSWPI